MAINNSISYSHKAYLSKSKVSTVAQGIANFVFRNNIDVEGTGEIITVEKAEIKNVARM